MTLTSRRRWRLVIFFFISITTSIDAMAGTLFGQDTGMVSCPAQVVDGGLRGLITGGMWGIAVAPLGISKENMSKEFTLRNTGRSMMGNAILFGAFLSVYSGVKCTLDPVLKKQPVANAFLSGSTAGFFASLVETRCTRASAMNGTLAGVCTASMVFAMARLHLLEE